MLRRIGFVPLLALNHAVDFHRWNGPLAYDPWDTNQSIGKLANAQGWRLSGGEHRLFESRDSETAGRRPWWRSTGGGGGFLAELEGAFEVA